MWQQNFMKVSKSTVCLAHPISHVGIPSPVAPPMIQCEQNGLVRSQHYNSQHFYNDT